MDFIFTYRESLLVWISSGRLGARTNQINYSVCNQPLASRNINLFSDYAKLNSVTMKIEYRGTVHVTIFQYHFKKLKIYVFASTEAQYLIMVQSGCQSGYVFMARTETIFYLVLLRMARWRISNKKIEKGNYSRRVPKVATPLPPRKKC